MHCAAKRGGKREFLSPALAFVLSSTLHVDDDDDYVCLLCHQLDNDNNNNIIFLFYNISRNLCVNE